VILGFKKYELMVHRPITVLRILWLNPANYHYCLLSNYNSSLESGE